MGILRFLVNLIAVIAAALFGNYVGDRLRGRATGEEGHQFQFTHNSPDGETVVAVNPNLTNLAPAVLAGLLLRPGLAWAFLGGVIASGFLGEEYEEKARALLKDKLPLLKKQE
jgi:hypothetical protein